MGTGNYIEKRLEESQVINLLIEKTKCQYGNLDFFYEVTNVPRTVDFNFDRYFIAKEILRSELSLEPNKKPGDIDILIIPAFQDTIYLNIQVHLNLKLLDLQTKTIGKTLIL